SRRTHCVATVCALSPATPGHSTSTKSTCRPWEPWSRNRPWSPSGVLVRSRCSCAKSREHGVGGSIQHQPIRPGFLPIGEPTFSRQPYRRLTGNFTQQVTHSRRECRPTESIDIECNQHLADTRRWPLIIEEGSGFPPEAATRERTTHYFEHQR